MSDDDKKDADVVPLQATRTDPVFHLADQLTKLIAAAPETMTPTQVIAALKLATDAYGAILHKSIGDDGMRETLRAAFELRRTYTFTSDWLNHVDEARRARAEAKKKREEARPQAKVFDFKKRKKDEKTT